MKTRDRMNELLSKHTGHRAEQDQARHRARLLHVGGRGQGIRRGRRDPGQEEGREREEVSRGNQVMDKRRDETHGNLSCSFCGKNQKEVKKLIAGPDRLHLRRVHRAVQRHHRRGDREGGAVVRARPPIPKPAEIKAVLDEYVIGQEQAKKILAVAVHNHYKRIDAKVGDRRRRAAEVQHPAARARPAAARRCSRRRSRASSTCPSPSPTRPT